tara:strand:- start:24405 stop:24830 length:426 start_codon:yes stop_codon:yes gene_type:complete
MTLTKRSFSAALAAVSLILTSGCASISVDPCSAEGIQLRVSQSLNSFARQNRADLNEIKQAATYLDGATTTGTMKIAFAARALTRVVGSFREIVAPEIQEIAMQCEVQEPVRDVFVEFLRDEGVNRQVIEWVEDFNLVFEN